MKYYSLNTPFTFGKHQGLSLLEVAINAPDYLNWCCCNLEHFMVNNDQLELLAGPAVKFQLAPDAREALNTKAEKERKIESARISWMNHDDDDNSSSFGKYEGSYAQEVEGYSDEDIDDIFDGDPDAYWNID